MSPTIPCPVHVGTPAASRTSEIEVVATGFGPFTGIEVNPSFEIISRLPDFISNDSGNGPNILIRKYPEPIKVSYSEVSETVPRLYRTLPNVRYFVHIGVHGHITRCRLERKAKRGPYTKPDVDGRNFTDDFEDKDGIWKDGPEEIHSQVDVDAIVERMVKSGEWDIDASNDPGLYLCEFIYYSSLARARQLREEGRDLKGLFVHVPPFLDSKSLDNERDTVVQVIREMVNEGQGQESHSR